MYKKRVSIALLIVIILATIFSSGISASAVSANAQSDLQQAQTRGQQYISQSGIKVCSNWENAELSNGITCYDLQSNIIGYMFSILKDDEYLGYIIMGNSSYNFDMLEAVSGAPLPSISAKEAKAIVANAGKQLDNVQPKLVYLGYRQLYSVYSSGNSQLAIDMNLKNLVDINALTSSLATPQQYQQNRINLMGSLVQSNTAYNILVVPLENGANAPSGYNSNDCGPTTGAMISEWWQGDYYTNLPSWTEDEQELYGYMDTNRWGLEGSFPGTSPTHFGPGFVQYASIHNYPSFSSDWCLNRDFSVIQTEINSSRPMGVMFSYYNYYAYWHWCVVTGYDLSGNIYMNDPNGGLLTSTNWALSKTTSIITRIRP